MALLLNDLVTGGTLYGNYRLFGPFQSDTLKTGILNVKTGALIANLTHTGTLSTDALTSNNQITVTSTSNSAINVPNGGLSALTGSFNSLSGGTLTATSATINGATTTSTLNVNGASTLAGTTTISTGSLNLTSGSITAGGTVRVQSTNDYNTTPPALAVDGGANIKLGLYTANLNTPKATVTALTATGGSTLTGGATVDNLTVQKTSTFSGLLTASAGLSVATSCNITSSITGVPSMIFNNAAGTGVYSSTDNGASTALYIQNGGTYIGGASAFKTSLSLLGGATSAAPVTITDTTDASIPNNVASLVLSGGLLSKKAIATPSTITTSSTSPTSISTSGGITTATISTGTATVTSTADYSSASQTGALTVSGGAYFGGTIGAAKSLSLNSGNLFIDAQPLAVSTNNAGTAFRIRNTNSSASTRITVANTSQSAYESSLNLFALGLEDGSSSNYERLNLGVNNTGGYLTHVAGGTGVVRTFNLMGGSTFTTGGSLNLASTSDYVSSTPTSASFFSSGGGYFSKTLAANGLTSLSSLNLPNTFSLYTAPVTVPTANNAANTTSGDALRIRSNDTTNPTTVVSVGNNAMGSNYYESDLVLSSLGADVSATNYERLTIAVNSSGAFINHSAGGTGTVKTLNMLNGSVFTTGGSLALSNTNDLNAATPSATSFYTAGGAYVSKMIGLGGSTMSISSAISSTSSTQTTTPSGSSILRVRSNDTTNSTTRLSVANTAMANNYYDSSIVLWSLGSSAASTNYERLILGANSTGGYLNYLYGGTGSLKTFNLMGGSTFSMNGALQLNTSLTLGSTNTVTRIPSPASTASYTLTEPPAPPAASGMMLTSTTTGVQSWSYVDQVYTGDGSTAAPTLLPALFRFYVLTQTLNNNTGQMAFYLTNNGQSGGTPLGSFAGIFFAARASAQSNTATNGPFATEAYRGSNGVVADVLVNRASGIVIGGTANGLQAAPTGTVVTCFAWIY